MSRQLLRPVRHVLLEDGEEEVGLAGEVGVDGAVGVAGLLGDLLHRGALVAALGEDGGGGGDSSARVRACFSALVSLFGLLSISDFICNSNYDTNLI